MDGASDFSKEDIAHQLGGMFVDGQSTQGETNSICQVRDKWHNPSQGNARGFGDNQAFGDSNPRDLGVEERDVRGMEVERH